jgi:hypothetical protein
MLQNGNRELILSSAIADHVPAMIVYSAGTVVVDWYFFSDAHQASSPDIGARPDLSGHRHNSAMGSTQFVPAK